jgi:hypothetical protein
VADLPLDRVAGLDGGLQAVELLEHAGSAWSWFS